MVNPNLPCDHPKADATADSDCRVCELYATDPKYRAMWDNKPISDEMPECRFRGDDLTGLERKELGLSYARWAPCSHPKRPNGKYVCPCSGCKPGCPGYELAPESD